MPSPRSWTPREQAELHMLRRTKDDAEQAMWRGKVGKARVPAEEQKKLCFLSGAATLTLARWYAGHKDQEAAQLYFTSAGDAFRSGEDYDSAWWSYRQAMRAVLKHNSAYHGLVGRMTAIMKYVPEGNRRALDLQTEPPKPGEPRVWT